MGCTMLPACVMCLVAGVHHGEPAQAIGIHLGSRGAYISVGLSCCSLLMVDRSHKRSRSPVGHRPALPSSVEMHCLASIVATQDHIDNVEDSLRIDIDKEINGMKDHLTALARSVTDIHQRTHEATMEDIDDKLHLMRNLARRDEFVDKEIRLLQKAILALANSITDAHICTHEATMEYIDDKFRLMRNTFARLDEYVDNEFRLLRNAIATARTLPDSSLTATTPPPDVSLQATGSRLATATQPSDWRLAHLAGF